MALCCYCNGPLAVDGLDPRSRTRTLEEGVSKHELDQGWHDDCGPKEG